jgi:hypothetical protein
MIIRALALFVALFFISGEVQASKLWIREFNRLGTQKQGDDPQVAQEPGVDQSVLDFSGGAVSSAATRTDTRFVRLVCDASCSYSVTTSAATATTTNALLPAGVVEIIGITGGAFINVRSNP